MVSFTHPTTRTATRVPMSGLLWPATRVVSRGRGRACTLVTAPIRALVTGEFRLEAFSARGDFAGSYPAAVRIPTPKNVPGVLSWSPPV